MNFDFFGIPINGTPPQFCERLLRNGRLDTTQGIENENNTYTVHIYMPEVCYNSIPLMIDYNPYTLMVYRAYISVEDVGLSIYSQLFNVINERYGNEYVKLPNKETVGWSFDEGRITLSRYDTATILSFTDHMNDADSDIEEISEEDDIHLIE